MIYKGNWQKLAIMSIRTMLVFIVAGFFFWLLEQNMAFAGTKVITYNFGIPNGQVTYPHPIARVKEVVHEGSVSYQEIIEEPVYVEVATLVPFQTVTIHLTFQNKSHNTVGVSVKYPGDSWRVTPLEYEGKEGEWTKGVATLDVSGAERKDNHYQFLVSVPGLTVNTPGAGSVLIAKEVFEFKKFGLLQQRVLHVWNKIENK